MEAGESTELYRGLRSQAAKVGISLNEACRRAQVRVSAVSKWRNKVPKSIETYEALQAVFREASEKV